MISPSNAAPGKYRRKWWLPGIVDRAFVVLGKDRGEHETIAAAPPDFQSRLERALSDPMAGQTLTEMGRALDPNFCIALHHGLTQLQRHALAERLTQSFQRGQLLIVKVPEVKQTSRLKAAAASPPPPPPPKKPKQKTWVEFFVVMEDGGEPVVGLKLRITLPDGIENFYTTNAQGKIRIDEIDDGTCEVTCDLKEARLPETLHFVGAGQGKPPADDSDLATRSQTGFQRIALVEAHKVKKGESIDLLAKGVGMTWQALSRFNWGTDIPDRINEHLRDDVGCTKKTASGKNYVFDESDNPGIMYIPRPWKLENLSTEATHVIRVSVPAPIAGFALIIPVELDPDGDSSTDDQVRIQAHDGSFERVLKSSAPEVTRDDNRRLLFYNFSRVPTETYVVSIRIKDQWVAALYGLEITANGARVNGRSVGENLDELHLGTPEDAPGGRPEDRQDLGDPVESSEIVDEDAVNVPGQEEEA